MALHETFIVFHEDLRLANNHNNTTPANATLFSNPSKNTATSDDGNPLLNAILSLGWLLLVVYCCCRRSNIPDERLWRGREMRERALEQQQRQLEEEARQNQSPLERKRLVQQAIITKVSKNASKNARGNEV
jgi:hypothetical protein